MAVDLQRAEALFTKALEHVDPVNRAAFVSQACGSDAELHRRVLALLAAHEQAGSFLKQPATTTEYAGTLHQDMTIVDRYQLIERLGEGGMGEVWAAKQSEPVKRKVAIKFIKTGMDSRAVLARFDQERQALAVMDHPNIARVYDGGLTAAGTPFFVMELVSGLPLNKYCDEAKLSVNDRLQLFVSICQAVQHAHQKGIVHRDLKPGNILVTLFDGKPTPKIIDFGVAKAVSGKLIDQSLSTQFGAVIGTMEYMAPEQAGLSTQDVDTRADIYSLGVILFEMLTGLRPIDSKRLKKAALDEMIRIIREEEAPSLASRLSTDESLPSVAAVRQIEPRRLLVLVKGELDWIVHRCLEKDRNRRYDTANGLARDVQRYLADEPVEARPVSVGYRVKKFVKRNRGMVLAASLVLIALIAGIIGTTLGLLEAQKQTELAQAQEAVAKKQEGIAQANESRAEAEKKRAVEFRNKALDTLRATTGTDVELLIGGKKELGANEKAYLEAIAKRWQAFAKQEGADEQARVIRAEGHQRVAYLWQKLDRREEALQEYEQALALWEMLAAEHPDVSDNRRDLALIHHNLGMVLKDLGKRAEAQQQFSKAFVIREKLAADFPAVPEHRRDLANNRNSLGLLLSDLGKQPETQEQFNKALVLQEKLAAEHPAVPEYRFDLAATHHNLGGLLESQGKQAKAQEQYNQALVIREKLVADFPTVPKYCSDLSASHNNMGALFAELGKWAEAQEQHNKARVIEEKLAADFPTVSKYRSDLAASHHNLGNLLSIMGKRAEAQEQYHKALVIQAKLATDFPTMPELRSKLSGTYNNLGTLLKGLGKWAEAQEQINKAILIREKLAADFPAVPDYYSDLAISHNNLATLLKSLGKRAEAEEQHNKALVIQEKLAANFPAVPDYRIGLGASYCNFGILVYDGGRANESLNWFDKAVATLTPVHRAEPRHVAAKQFLRNSHLSRARAYDQLQNYAEAVKDWDKAIEFSSPAEQVGLRASRSKSRPNAAMVAEVAELTKSSNWNASQWYSFACVYAVASTKIPDKKQEYADRAMELLQKAVKAGYKDAAHLAKDTDLEPLRGREDFKKLLAGLTKLPASEKKP